MMTAWQRVSQGSKYLSLTLCSLSSLPVSAIGQIKLRAHRKGNCVPGHHSLASQGTDQGGQGWMVGLEEQEMKAQQGSVTFHPFRIAWEDHVVGAYLRPNPVCAEPHVNTLGQQWAEL